MLQIRNCRCEARLDELLYIIPRSVQKGGNTVDAGVINNAAVATTYVPRHMGYLLRSGGLAAGGTGWEPTTDQG